MMVFRSNEKFLECRNTSVTLLDIFILKEAVTKMLLRKWHGSSHSDSIFK